MVEWKNLDELNSFKELEACEKVDLKTVMSGNEGAERVKTYSCAMAEGLTYNYAAKAVDA